ncbi:MAG: zinc permease [Cyclobacteriaceae bacterium]|nr:zinc permease [Cyclobacteriaceae bacterium HetDA_MAG_MS6]
MTLIILILFISTLCGGMLVYFTGYQHRTIKEPLIFAGSFLFTITIIHILPELFSLSDKPMKMGLFILVGFYFQQFLEYFTSGVEHGHFHEGKLESTQSRVGLVLALIVHSVLEGALLTHESPFHDQHESYSLLLGIIFHKVPAAFALMTIIRQNRSFHIRDGLTLMLFSIASPIGLLLSDVVLSISYDHLLVIFAVVSGSFFHISTTIFVETSPNHHLGVRRTIASLIGAALAILTEYSF